MASPGVLLRSSYKYLHAYHFPLARNVNLCAILTRLEDGWDAEPEAVDAGAMQGILEANKGFWDQPWSF